MIEDVIAGPLAEARSWLQPRAQSDRSLQALAAAAFFAICALVFCAAAVLAPANVQTPMARSGTR